MTLLSTPVGSRADWWHWSRVSVVCVALLLAAFVCLEVVLDGAIPSAYVAGVAGGAVLTGSVVKRTVTRTRQSHGRQRITIATWVTIARGGALSLLAGFVLVSQPSGWAAWLPGVLFATAAGLDAVDGAIARATDAVSELGGRLDTEMDGLTVLLGSAIAVWYGAAPIAFIAVGLARYAFVGGIRYRQRTGRPVYDLDPRQLRRYMGALAMVTIWLALLPIPGRDVSWLLATLAMIPFLANFTRDWLVVSGRIDPSR